MYKHSRKDKQWKMENFTNIFAKLSLLLPHGPPLIYRDSIEWSCLKARKG